MHFLQCEQESSTDILRALEQMHANSGVDPSHKNRWRISRPCANSHLNRERKNTILFFLACFSNCRSVFYLFNSMSSTSRRSIRIHIIITTNKKKYQHHQHMIRQLCQIQDVLLALHVPSWLTFPLMVRHGPDADAPPSSSAK